MVPAPRETRESERIRPMQPDPSKPSSRRQAQPCSEPTFDNGERSSMRLRRILSCSLLLLPIDPRCPQLPSNCLQFTHRLRRLAAVSRDGREPNHVAQRLNLTGFAGVRYTGQSGRPISPRYPGASIEAILELRKENASAIAFITEYTTGICQRPNQRPMIGDFPGLLAARHAAAR